MKSRTLKGSWIAIAALFVAFPAFAAPEGVHAQQAQEEVEIPEFSDEMLEVLTQAHLEIEEIRDQLHEDMAEWHDNTRRQEVRAEADERLAAVLEEHGITEEEYELFIYAISIDAERREAYERVREEIDGDER